MLRRTPLLLLALLTAAPRAAVAQGDGWPFHGFVQANWSVRTTGVDRGDLVTKDFLLGEERLQLELERFSASGAAGLLVKIDLSHDALGDRADLEVREAYVDFVMDPIALRFGRQMMTWGVGDLIFINDVFPKDYAAFFSGRPLQYLKVGVDALRLDLNSALASAEIVLIPSFQPDRTPKPDRFVLFDPFPGLERVERRPELRLSNIEIAVRLYRRLAGADVSLYAYRGFYGSPAPRPQPDPGPDRLLLLFPRLNVYGASLAHAAFSGIVTAEAGYYDSREDPDGSDPWVPNSEIRALVGYQRQLGPQTQLGVQYYAEWMQNREAYLANLGPAVRPRDEVRHVATLRYTQQLAYETWQLGFFVFLGLSEADYLAIPEIRHKFSEDLWAALGANLFGGEPQDLFGALDANDNVYITARYGF
jgi:hypothetical protein